MFVSVTTFLPEQSETVGILTQNDINKTWMDSEVFYPLVQQIRSYKFQNDVQTVLMLTLIQFYVSYTLDTNLLQKNFK